MEQKTFGVISPFADRLGTFNSDRELSALFFVF